MDDARLVRVPQRPGELLDHQRGQLGRKETLALGEALERLTAHQLGDQERVLGGRRVGEVEHLEDVGVLQPGHCPGLAGEPRAGVLLPCQMRMEDLDRDLTLQRGVDAAVDDRHAPRAELLEQPISPQVPALEAHPEMAPPQSTNARQPRNVPHCSGMAAAGGHVVSDGPGQRHDSAPVPVRAFPASYASVSRGSTSPRAQTSDAAPSGLGTASVRRGCSPLGVRCGVRPVSYARISGVAGGTTSGFGRSGVEPPSGVPARDLNGSDSRALREHLVHLGDEDELDAPSWPARGRRSGPSGRARGG